MRNRTILVWFVLLAITWSIEHAPGDSPVQRRDRLEKMSAADREELRSKQERFEKLDPSEQQGLRQLEQSLRVDPQGDRLRELMVRYQDWLRTLPSSRRMEILSAPPEQRVDKIKGILADQDEQRRQELAIQALSHEDLETVRAWMREIMKRAEPGLLDNLSEEQRKDFPRSQENRLRLIGLIEAASRKRGLENDPFRFEVVLNITEDDRQKLVAMLSPGAQAAYRQAKDETERRRLVQSWNRAAALREKFHASPEDLRQFLERADPKTRERLENLPHDQMRAELERLIRYERSRFIWDGGGPSPKGRFGGPGSKKPDDPRPRDTDQNK